VYEIQIRTTSEQYICVSAATECASVQICLHESWEHFGSGQVSYIFNLLAQGTGGLKGTKHKLQCQR